MGFISWLSSALKSTYGEGSKPVVAIFRGISAHLCHGGVGTRANILHQLRNGLLSDDDLVHLAMTVC